MENTTAINVQYAHITESYIPLKLSLICEWEQLRYVSISKGKKSLLELAVGQNSGMMHRLVLLLCADFQVSSEQLVLNSYSTQKPNIPLLTGIECPVFRTVVYANGVQMVLSDKKTERYLKVSDVYWGLSESEELTEVVVLPMSTNEIDHIKKELAYQ